MPQPPGYSPPYLLGVGENYNVEQLRILLDSFQKKVTSIRGQDLYRNDDGLFTLNSDLDLGGNDLYGARNVPVGQVNVRSLGVAGDGLTDDTQAMKSALARIHALGFGSAFIPAGTFILRGQVEIPPIRIFGSGSGTRIWQANTTEDGSTTFVAERDGTIIENMRFQAAGTRNGIGILAQGVKELKIKNIWGRNMNRLISISDAQDVTVDTIHGYQCNQALRMTKLNGCNLETVISREAHEIGIEVSDAEDFSFTNLISHSGLSHGAKFTACNAGTVQGSFRKNHRTGVSLAGSSMVSLSASQIWDNSIHANDKHPGIELSACSGCSVESVVSVSLDVQSSQTYGIVLIGGSDNMVALNILLPNRGPEGTASGADAMDRRWTIDDRAENTRKIANHRIFV